ncbi:MAG: TonB-dependent receptor [Caldithrix sp.]|nr:TonB-dependent receptor [Caldithrix sp.]
MLVMAGRADTGIPITEFFIRDIWSDQPIRNARVIVDAKQFYTDDAGNVKIGFTLTPGKTIRITKEGYFTKTLQTDALASPLIYLVPVEETERISAIIPRDTDEPLFMPTHVTRISLTNRTNEPMSLWREIGKQSGIFMKSYGISGQLQNIALRGMTAAQTQLLFDGIPIQNLQLGTGDLSHFNRAGIDKVDIYRGGSTLFGGTGAVGGAINMRTAPLSAERHYTVRAGYASIDNSKLSARLNWPVMQWRQRLTMHYGKGNNRYTVKQDGRDIELRNRDFRQHTIMYEGGLSVTDNLRVNMLVRSFKKERGAPRPFQNKIVEEQNVARSDIDNTLLRLKAIFQGRWGSWSAQTYVRNEWMNYMDASLNIDEEILHSTHFNQERGLQFRWRLPLHRNFAMQTGYESADQRIQSSEAGEHQRLRQAVYAIGVAQLYADSAAHTRMEATAQLRRVWYTHRNPIDLPGGGITVYHKRWQWYASVNTNYRQPTFNDLYWRPGGNPNLQPEQSINLETGVAYRQTFLSRIIYDSRISLYRNRVRHQIQWLPEGLTWQPRNVNRVLSQGIELFMALQTLNKHHQIQWHYTRGLTEKIKKSFAADNTKGNQLPFIPKEQWHIQGSATWRILNIGMRVTGTSFRYTTIANRAEDILPAHTRTDCWISVTKGLADQQFTVIGMMENALDTDYEVMPGYPMPGRFYKIELKIMN